jgi:DNA-binding Xre family transcriptional regulator
MAIRWRVDELLTQRGMTRYRLARKAGLSPSGLYRMLDKPTIKRLDMATLEAIADVLAVKPLELLQD